MPCPTVVVVGASAGGLEAVRTLVGGLPADFPASVFVVIHRGAAGPTLLPELLSRVSRLPVLTASNGERLKPGHVYVAPVDCHILLGDSRVRVTRGPRQHGFRPAVDPLFISAANAHRECVAGVILSGALDDGTAGLMAVKRMGGFAIVQDPEEALVPSMPLSAMKNVNVDEVLLASEIGPRLAEIVRTGTNRTARAVPPRRSKGPNGAMATTGEPNGTHDLTPFTCPSCGGALWEVDQGTVSQYECHVGHRFGSEALKALGEERTEALLWSAARALQEDSMLRRRMAAHAGNRGMHAMARRWLDDAETFGSNSRQIRRLIEAMTVGGDEEAEARVRAPRVRVRQKAKRAPTARARGRQKSQAKR